MSDERAAEYVLGLLRDDARDAFERALSQTPTLQAEIRAWQRKLAPLADALPATPPPPALWDKIARATDAAPGLVGSHTVRAGEGTWQALAPGAWINVLHVDRAQRVRSFLLRLDPGAVLPGHDHRSDEECVVLEGEMIIAGTRLSPGDYHLGRRGLPHGAISSPGGGLIFIRGALDEHADRGL